MTNNIQIVSIISFIVILIHQSVPGDCNLIYNKDKDTSCTYDIEICQNCAKDTKSDVVYPYCCENKEGVFKWCRAYVGFGLQKRNGQPQMKKLKCHKFPYWNPETLRKEYECICTSDDQKKTQCFKSSHLKYNHHGDDKIISIDENVV